MNSNFLVDQTLSLLRSNPVASFFLLLLFQTTRDRLGQPLRRVEALGTPAQRVTRFRWHASGQMSHLILENPATGVCYGSVKGVCYGSRMLRVSQKFLTK